MNNWIDDAKRAFTLEQLLDELECQSCDLRCVDVATGGDDYDIEWIVIEYRMSEPQKKEIGRGRSVIAALKDAFPEREVCNL